VWCADAVRRALPSQATVTGMEGWVRCMSFDASGDVGDLGAVFAADESGGITRLQPHAVWDATLQRWTNTGAGCALAPLPSSAQKRVECGRFRWLGHGKAVGMGCARVWSAAVVGGEAAVPRLPCILSCVTCTRPLQSVPASCTCSSELFAYR
jgi:hypothetical protein